VDKAYGVMDDLKAVARTKGHVAMYIGNGHAAWEAALANVLQAGDTVLVPATGRFAHGWASMAETLGVKTHIIDFGKQSAMQMGPVSEALAADKDHKIKAVLGVHVDTSTSIKNDIKGLRGALDAEGHPALLMADCIASLGCDRFEMDDWGVDVMVTGCQKGLMVPPGMAFVFFNDRANEVRGTLPRVSQYWDWRPRAWPDEPYMLWCGTAPTQHIHGLRVGLDLIHAEGMEAVWTRHERLARAIWAACDAWGEAGALKMNVADPNIRSHAVTSLKLTSPHGTALRDWTEENLNLTLGIGLGMATPGDPEWHGFFRLGHMGHVSGHMIMGLLGGIDAGLKALDIPHGPGALEAASAVIAKG
jgi:alanine-glyoxylate transaminase/serine-glyoxylate transaminase/serine-pyruvate transaminase